MPKLSNTETELEKLLRRWFRSYEEKWEYVGNKDFYVGKYNPDFVYRHNGSKKIIELFGCRWHCCEKCGYNEQTFSRSPSSVRASDKKKLKYYKQRGWECLVIWEHDMPDIFRLRKVVEEFTFGKLTQEIK